MERRQHLAQLVAGEVRAEIARQGLTAAIVSARTGIARSSLSRKLGGSHDFTLGELARVCTALDVNLSDLTERAERSAVA